MSFEFLEHTADIIIRATGADLKEAFEQGALAFYEVMTSLDSIDKQESKEVSVQAEDKESLLYEWIDQLIFLFDTEYFVAREVNITTFELTEKENQKLTIQATLVGEPFQIGKHPQESEVKAMTYAFMKITDTQIEFTLDL